MVVLYILFISTFSIAMEQPANSAHIHAQIFTHFANTFPPQCTVLKHVKRLFPLGQCIPPSCTRLEGHTNGICTARFNHDGSKVVTASKDQRIGMWDAQSGSLLYLRGQYWGEVAGASFNDDGSLIAAATRDNKVLIIDTQTGKVQKTFKSNVSMCSPVFKLGTRHVMIGETYGTLVPAARIVDIDKPPKEASIVEFKGHQSEINAVALSPDGLYAATASSFGMVRIFKSDTGELVREIECHREDWLDSVAFHPHNQDLIVTVAHDGAIRIWDIKNMNMVHEMRQDGQRFNYAAFSPDGNRIVSSCDNKAVDIWDAQTGEHLQRFEGHKKYVSCAEFNHDGTKVVSSSNDKTARIWHLDWFKTLSFDRMVSAAKLRLLAIFSGLYHGCSGRYLYTPTASERLVIKHQLWPVLSDNQHKHILKKCPYLWIDPPANDASLPDPQKKRKRSPENEPERKKPRT